MKYEVDKIISRLPSNKQIAEEVLKMLNNNKTKIEENNDIKGCYYSFINDTMYISTSALNMQNANRAIVVCHECRHSVQNKKIQVMNTIISNLLLILYLIQFILLFFNKNILALCIIIAGINVFIRGLLEVDATINSLKIFNNYLNSVDKEKDFNVINKYFNVKLKFGAFFYFFKIFIDKFWPIAILEIIKLLKYHIIN